jgi:ribosome-associated protein
MNKNDFVTQEVEKIVNDTEFDFPQNMAMAAAWILGNLKGVNLKILNTKKSSSLSDYYILASANNNIQARSMADAITTQLRSHGCKVLSKEGLDDADWILLDLGDIIVHIFLETSRSAYNLDEVWSSGEVIEIPQSYYFSSEEGEVIGATKDDKGYF